MQRRNGWNQIGVVGVDSGTILVGDPCYWMSEQDYDNNMLKDFNNNTKQLKYDLGHNGKGVLATSGFGDGVYPVEVKYGIEGRVKELRVKFF